MVSLTNERYQTLLKERYRQVATSAVRFFSICLPLQWLAAFAFTVSSTWSWTLFWSCFSLGFVVTVPVFLVLKSLAIIKQSVLAECFIDSHPENQISMIAAAKLAALGEMAGGVAHEINTPLAIIRMTVDTLEERLIEGTVKSEDLKHSLSMIGKTVDRISKIITALRQFTGNRTNIPVRLVPVSSLIDSTLIFCAERFKNNSVALKYDQVSCERLSPIECRSVEISQVLLNLLNNSFDAIQDLPEKWIRIEAQEHANAVEIFITDSGHGIAQAIREKIMQPFFTTKDIGKGTGLGLSVSKGLIESHDGRFYLDTSHANTRFVIQLPKKQKMAAQNSTAA